MTIELSSHVCHSTETILVSNLLIHSIRHLFHGISNILGEGIQKIELLNTQLQNYNDRLNDFLRGRGYMNIQQLDDYVCEHTFEDLRVTLINEWYQQLRLIWKKIPCHFENHHNRQK